MKKKILSNLQSLFLLHLRKKIGKFICYFVLNTPVTINMLQVKYSPTGKQAKILLYLTQIVL